MKLRIPCFLILILISIVSCQLGTGKSTGKGKQKISVVRYDKLLSEYVRSNSFSAMQKLNMEYQQPTKILIEDVLAIGTVKDDTISQKLRNFYSDTTLLRLIDDVETRFPNLNDVNKKLNKGFKKLKKELPNTKVPFIYSQISAFNESIILSDTLLGISLDKYMGEDYPLYKRFYYDYQCRSMRPERIVPDCFLYYLLNQYNFVFKEGTCLLDLMLHYGKIYYVVEKILDYKSIGETIGYSEQENEWCNTNEEKIWRYMVANNHLNAKDPMVLRRYMKPSDGVKLFEQTAPGLIGIWLGARIVDTYMKKHKDFKIKDLLLINNYALMLKESGYSEEMNN